MLVACIRVSTASIHTCYIRGEESATLCQVVWIYSRYASGLAEKRRWIFYAVSWIMTRYCGGKNWPDIGDKRASNLYAMTSIKLHDKWMFLLSLSLLLYLFRDFKKWNEMKLSSFLPSLSLSRVKNSHNKRQTFAERVLQYTCRKSLPTCWMRTNSLLMLSRLKHALLMILMGVFLIRIESNSIYRSGNLWRIVGRVFSVIFA